MIYRPVSPLLLILVVFILASCGRPDLSRQDAARLLETSTKLGEYKANLLLQDNAEQQGIALGWWQMQGGAVTNLSPRIRSEGSVVKRAMFGFGNAYLVLNTPAAISVTVTGIAGDKNQTTRTVDFDWQYKDLQPLSRRIAIQGGKGNAVFQIYDDGWRLAELLSMTLSSSPYPLSEQEKQDLAKDLAAEHERRAAAEQVAAAAKRHFAERFQLSKTPTKILRQFDLEKITGLGYVLTSIKITDVGVEIASREKLMSKLYDHGSRMYLYGNMLRKYTPASEFNDGFLDLGGAPTGLLLKGAEVKEIPDAVNDAHLGWRQMYPDVINRCEHTNTWTCDDPR